MGRALQGRRGIGRRGVKGCRFSGDCTSAALSGQLQTVYERPAIVPRARSEGWVHGISHLMFFLLSSDEEASKRSLCSGTEPGDTRSRTCNRDCMLSPGHSRPPSDGAGACFELSRPT